MKYFVLALFLLKSTTCVDPYPIAESPESVVRGTKQFSEKVLISGLAGPWELTWGPDEMLWVTERTGKRVTRIDPTTGEKSVAITIAEVSAPGGQDGLLGLALHPELLKGTGNDYVYVAYTYLDESEGPDPNVTDPNSPFRYLYSKIVQLTYNQASGTLSNPVELITGLPAGDDHNAGRLKVGPDSKLYFTIGDHGHDQLANFCLPIEAQRAPTQADVDGEDYVSYVGKSLRLDLDGSVPADNPQLAGVVSHVFTYGHRNPQGIDFGPDGTLYSSEHGPKTDDEINILKSGSNYGWPHVAGVQDDSAYEYARWPEASTPCADLTFDNLAIHPSVPREPESAYTTPFVSPIATMFTVPSDYSFHDPVCKGIDYICWPTVGASSIEYYQSEGDGIPGWDKVLFVTTLKRGSLYVVSLDATGQTKTGPMSRYFQSDNRFRDSAVNPDGKTIYIATDPGGLAEAVAGGTTRTMRDPGAILVYTYKGEGPAGGETSTPEPTQTSEVPDSDEAPATSEASDGAAPQFTAAQAATGKTAYDSNCAVCHGTTMTNGTFGTPLAGEYFKGAWTGQTVKDFFDYAKTMPPSSPGSLPDDTYADIVAYVLEVNGFEPGATALPADTAALEGMTIH
jgi:PQQ-dependent dehydrogenase (s-GDH family)